MSGRPWHWNNFAHLFILEMSSGILQLKKTPISTSDDLARFINKLKECSLPYSDLSLTKQVLYEFSLGDMVIGTGGLEIYDQYALLRSVSIASDCQRKNLGTGLVNQMLEIARNKKVSVVYLLTTNAEHFFRKLGFESVQREDAPASIKSTKEFTGICPTSAKLMAIRI